MFTQYLNKIITKDSLTREESADALQSIIDEKVSPTEIGAFLFGLRMKGESTSELLGFLDTMEMNMVKIDIKDKDAIDVCGTGGDSKHSFNVSTTAAIIVAAAGVTVAKHGNRSVSSRSGSADVLEKLGIKIDLTPNQSRDCINETGICFLFAPLYHPAMKVIAPHRKNLGLRTFFNMLGPLLNPVNLRRQLIGVYDLQTAKKLAAVLKEKRYSKAITVHSSDGYDEISPFAHTHVFEVDDKNESLIEYSFTPPPMNKDVQSISGGSSAENAATILDILNCKITGADRRIVVLNAAFGLYVGGKVDDIEKGIALAEEIVDNGLAIKKLNEYKEFSNSVN